MFQKGQRVASRVTTAFGVTVSDEYVKGFGGPVVIDVRWDGPYNFTGKPQRCPIENLRPES
jgi:hypothetical protein